MWSAILDRVLRRPLVSLVLAGGLLLALAAPALHLHIADARHRDAARRTSPSMKTYNKLQKAFPGQANSAQVVVKTDDARRPAVNSGDRRPEAPGDRDRAVLEPDRRRVLEPARHDRSRLARDAGQRRRRRRRWPRSQTLRNTVVPATVGKLDGAEVGVTGQHRKAEGHERPDEARRTVRVRVRAHARVPADAAHVPVGRHRDQGRAAQPALGRGGLRRPGARLPGRLGQGPARLRAPRREGSSASCRSSCS